MTGKGADCDAYGGDCRAGSDSDGNDGFVIGDVLGWTVYRNGSLVVRRDGGGSVGAANGQEMKDGRRGVITKLTNRALSRMAMRFVESGDDWRSMITLTYPTLYPTDGRATKGHLSCFLDKFRLKFGPREMYFWFLEFQSRGAPHFHVITTVSPTQGRRVWMADAWVGCISASGLRGGLVDVIRGCQRCKRVHQHRDSWQSEKVDGGLGRYIVKYASKVEQKSVPPRYSNVGRWWGCSRNVGRPVPVKEYYAGEEQLREYLAGIGRTFDGWRYVPKIVLAHATGAGNVSRETFDDG